MGFRAAYCFRLPPLHREVCGVCRSPHPLGKVAGHILFWRVRTCCCAQVSMAFGAERTSHLSLAYGIPRHSCPPDENPCHLSVTATNGCEILGYRRSKSRQVRRSPTSFGSSFIAC